MSEPLETTLGTCSVCGDPTKWACVDCRDDIAATVHVCGYSPRCRKAHEEKCTTKLRGEIAALRKQLSESEAEIAEYKSESWCFNESHTKLTAEVATLHRENEGLTATVTTLQESSVALRQALEAAKGALERIDDMCEEFNTYGTGYISKEATAALAQIESLTPSVAGETDPAIRSLDGQQASPSGTPGGQS